MTAHISPRHDNGVFQYVRRVPRGAAHLDARGTVRVGLGTRDKREALARARALDAKLEKQWQSLMLTTAQARTPWAQYDVVHKLADAIGFSYATAAAIAALALSDILRRIQALGRRSISPTQCWRC